MKNIIYISLGVLFGIALSKAEIVSWYRIIEMFRFESFHMYGVIGTAAILGAIGTFLMKKMGTKTISGEEIVTKEKELRWAPLLIGGSLFGLGWAMTGACPGPMYILLGNGMFIFGIALLSAVLGAFVYGSIRHKLPQ